MGRLYITDCRPGERMNSGNDAMKALQRGLRRRQDTEAREADRVICGNSCGSAGPELAAALHLLPSR